MFAKVAKAFYDKDLMCLSKARTLPLSVTTREVAPTRNLIESGPPVTDQGFFASVPEEHSSRQVLQVIK